VAGFCAAQWPDFIPPLTVPLSGRGCASARQRRDWEVKMDNEIAYRRIMLVIAVVGLAVSTAQLWL
jgi:hypothetical protein